MTQETSDGHEIPTEPDSLVDIILQGRQPRNLTNAEVEGELNELLTKLRTVGLDGKAHALLVFGECGPWKSIPGRYINNSDWYSSQRRKLPKFPELSYKTKLHPQTVQMLQRKLGVVPRRNPDRVVMSRTEPEQRQTYNSSFYGGELFGITHNKIPLNRPDLPPGIVWHELVLEREHHNDLSIIMSVNPPIWKQLAARLSIIGS